MAKRGPREKPFVDYLRAGQSKRSALADYARSPASTFLHEACHLHDAMNMCINKFPRRVNGSFVSDSQDSLERLSASAIAALMGHFETFQRFLFAGMVEHSRFFSDFDLGSIGKNLSDRSTIEVDLKKMLAYRGETVTMGLVLADNLSSWHDPGTVNRYFAAITPGTNFYSNAQVSQLRILWQIRHSIVHTAGWLTLPDSQKVKDLNHLGNKQLRVSEAFVPNLVRRFHKLLYDPMKRLESAYRKLLRHDISRGDLKVVDLLFKFDSRYRTWIPK